jgi:hypothetical protein
MIAYPLSAGSMKLFFKRPAEMFGMLENILKKAIEESVTQVDLRDRALLYYRLLQANADETKRVRIALCFIIGCAAGKCG